MTELSRRQWLLGVGGAALWSRVDFARAAEQQRGIPIRNPRLLHTSQLEAERIAIGEKGLYKPVIAALPNGELVVICYISRAKNSPTFLFRSSDGGRTWQGPEKLPIVGAEPYFTALANGHLLVTGASRDAGSETIFFLHRSEDAGRTYTGLKLSGLPNAVTESRNVLERRDGSLLAVVNEKPGASGTEHIASSRDGGRTWSVLHEVTVRNKPGGYRWGVFSEAHLLDGQGGKIYAIARVDHRYYPLPGRVLSPLEYGNIACSLYQYGYPLKDDISQMELDHLNHLKLFVSADVGKTWEPLSDLGDYGMMFPSVLRLGKGRLLLTFTRRSIDPPLGVRAVFGREDEHGFHFDFDHDVMLIDTKTPVGRGSGGGFGPTVRLQDGTLVTSYSYWPPDDQRKPDDWRPPDPSQCEIARWRLPEIG